MSEADRRKWDARYRDGAFVERTWPSEFLVACAERLPRRGRALDLACGAGRNALFLAQRGLTVDAVDISAVALARARKDGAGLAINWLQADLETDFPWPRQYDVIVNIRYVNPPLVTALARRLAPGGALIVEQHLRHEKAEVGPGNPAFRVAPGTLRQLAEGLSVVTHEEGLFRDPDNGVAALARLFATAPAKLGFATADSHQRAHQTEPRTRAVVTCDKARR